MGKLKDSSWTYSIFISINKMNPQEVLQQERDKFFKEYMKAIRPVQLFEAAQKIKQKWGGFKLKEWYNHKAFIEERNWILIESLVNLANKKKWLKKYVARLTWPSSDYWTVIEFTSLDIIEKKDNFREVSDDEILIVKWLSRKDLNRLYTLFRILWINP